MQRSVAALIGLLIVFSAVSLASVSMAGSPSGFTTVCWGEQHGLARHHVYCNKTNNLGSTVKESFDAWVNVTSVEARDYAVYNRQNVEHVESCTLHDDCDWYNTTDGCSVAWCVYRWNNDPGDNRTVCITSPVPAELLCPDDNRTRYCHALYKAKGVKNASCLYSDYTDVVKSYYYDEWIKVPVNYTEHDNRFFKGSQLSYAGGETKTFRLEWSTPIAWTGGGWGSTGYWQTNPGSWWNTSLPYRYQIYSNASTQAFLNVNDSYWPNIWTLNETIGDPAYLYCENTGCTSGGIGIGNETDELYWENASTLTGNEPRQLYPANMSLMYHLENHAEDSSRHINDGSVSGTPIYYPMILGSGMKFDGSDDFIDTQEESDFSFGAGPFSTCMWFNTTTLAGNKILISNAHYSGGWHGWHVEFESSAVKVYYGKPVVLFSGAININQWYHLCITRDASNNVALYLDGELNDTDTDNTNVNNAGKNLYIGRNNDATYPRYFSGEMDEVMVWNASLTATQVAEMASMYRYNNLSGTGGVETYGDGEDATPPDITFTSPTAANGTVAYLQDYVEWNVSISENASSCLFELNSSNQTGTVLNSTATTSCWYNETGLSTTSNQTTCAWAYADDAAGNLNVTLDYICRTTQYETDPPDVTLNFPVNDSHGRYYDEPVNVTYTDGYLDSCWWTDVAGGVNTTASCTSNITGPWFQGLNIVTVYANDTSANLNSSTVYFTVDGIKPDITFTSPTAANGTVAYLQDYVEWNVSISENASSCLFELNSSNQTGTVLNSTGTTSCWYNETGFTADVSTCARAYATDYVGNLNVTDFYICRNLNVTDKLPPDITIYEPENITYTTLDRILNSTFTDQGETETLSHACYSLNGAANVTYSNNLTLLSVITPEQSSYTLLRPTGMTTDGEYIFILDSGTYTCGAGAIDPCQDKYIAKYWLNGSYMDSWNISGHWGAPDYLKIPWGICHNDTYLFIINSFNDRVHLFWHNGTYTGSQFTTQARTSYITGCDFSNNNLYISDHSGDAVFRYWANGSYISNASIPNNEASFPFDVAIYSNHYWLTVDVGDEIRLHDMDGHATGFNFSIYEGSDGIDTYGDTLYVLEEGTEKVYTYRPLPALSAVQGSNTVTVWANDSAGNANSSSVSFYADSIAPALTENRQTPSTCVKAPGIIRLTWEQSDNLDDLNVTCRFTNPITGVITQLDAVPQTANSSSGCSLMLASIGQWDIHVRAQDYSGNHHDVYSSIDVRLVCSGDSPGGGGGAYSVTNPTDIILTRLPNCTVPGYTYDIMTGRCRPSEEVGNLTPMSQLFVELTRPRFIQVAFNYTAVDTSTDRPINVAHTAYLFSIAQLLITGLALGWVYTGDWLPNKGKFSSRGMLVLVSVLLFNIISVSTAIPGEYWSSLVSTGRFAPDRSLTRQVPGPAAGPAAGTSYEAPLAGWLSGAWTYVLANPVVIALAALSAFAMISAAAYISRLSSRRYARRYIRKALKQLRPRTG